MSRWSARIIVVAHIAIGVGEDLLDGLDEIALVRHTILAHEAAVGRHLVGAHASRPQVGVASEEQDRDIAALLAHGIGQIDTGRSGTKGYVDDQPVGIEVTDLFASRHHVTSRRDSEALGGQRVCEEGRHEGLVLDDEQAPIKDPCPPVTRHAGML